MQQIPPPVGSSKDWRSIDAIGAAFKDLKNNLSSVAWTGAILCLPLLAAKVITAANPSTLISILVQLTSFFPTIVWFPVAIIRASREFAVGQSPGPGKVIDAATNRRLFSYLGVQFVIAMTFALIALVSLAPAIGVGASSFAGARGDITKMLNGPVAGTFLVALALGGLVLIVAVVFLYLRWGLAGVVSVLEDASATASLGRSRDLLRGRKLDLFVLMLIGFGITAVVGLILQGPALVVQGGFAAQLGNPLDRPAVSAAGAMVIGLSTYLATIVSVSIQTSMITNYYLFVRGDEMLSGATATPGEVVVVHPPAPPEPSDRTQT